jgi:chemotaxis regulatin CheY-phosphate phosphatase CheZ
VDKVQDLVAEVVLVKDKVPAQDLVKEIVDKVQDLVAEVIQALVIVVLAVVPE